MVVLIPAFQTARFGLDGVGVLGDAGAPGALTGLVDYYILEHPVLGALAVLLVGIVAAEVFRRLSHGRWALVSLGGAVAMGGLVMWVGVSVETPRERVTADTRELVEAIVDARVADVESRLAPRVMFRTDGRVNATLDRDWLLGVSRGLKGVFKSHSIEVQDVVFMGAETSAQSRFLSRAEFTTDSFGLVPSIWEFTWRRDGADGPWRVTSVECLKIYGKPATGEWINWGNRHRR